MLAEIHQEELSTHDKIDYVESKMVRDFLPIECPLEHIMTPGLYTRVIKMPAGAGVTSKIHRTEHPFFILAGKVSVFMEETGWVDIEAPYVGVTKPGTRRVIIVHEECIWATCHTNPDEEDLEQIEARIIEKHENPLLEGYKSELHD